MSRLARLFFVGALLAVVILPVALLAGLTGDARPTAATVAAVDGRADDTLVAGLRQALRENPEIILEALQILRQRQQQSGVERSGAAVRAHAAEIFNDPESPVGGNPDGDVTVVEFFDYRCQYCKSAHAVLSDLVAADGRIRFVYKEFPILGPQSVAAARAALAANRQGLYVPFHDALMGAQGALDNDQIFRIAERAGLDVGRLRADMESDDIDRAIRENLMLARRLNIQGTPAFVIGERVIPGAIDRAALEQLVRLARNG